MGELKFGGRSEEDLDTKGKVRDDEGMDDSVDDGGRVSKNCPDKDEPAEAGGISLEEV